MCACAGITIMFSCRFIPTIDRFPCQSLRTNLGPLIPFLVKTQRMTMDSLFQVCAGEGNPTCLLQPIQVDVWKCCRWFKGKAPHGWITVLRVPGVCPCHSGTLPNPMNPLGAYKNSFDIFSYGFIIWSRRRASMSAIIEWRNTSAI